MARRYDPRKRPPPVSKLFDPGIYLVPVQDLNRSRATEDSAPSSANLPAAKTTGNGPDSGLGSEADVSHFFKRKLRKPAPYIESVCKRCGTLIEGAIGDAHAQNERDHIAGCSGTRLPGIPKMFFVK